MLGEAFPGVITAARAGAGWAFERLWADVGPLVAGYLRLQGAREPDDLASEVVIGLFKGLRRFEGDEAALRSYVLVIAHRRLLDERRRLARRPPPSGAVPERAGGDAEEDALAALGEAEVRALLGDLPSAQRDVLLLRIIGDLTVDQVAAIVGRRPGAVKALQRRGLTRLRDRLGGTLALLAVPL